MDVCTHGWSRDDLSKKLVPIMIPQDTPVAPREVLQMIRCGCTTAHRCSTLRCGCAAARMSCSMYCRCKGEDCYNPFTVEAAAEEER